MSKHPELDSEQAYLDHAYERVGEMRVAARKAMEDVLDLGRGGTFQSRTERDVVVRNSLARLDQLDIGSQPLCFGRTDATSGERFYIGRMGVSGREQEPLIIDWRARVAEPFYRATGRHPMGLMRRRHFEVKNRRIIGIEDEPLDFGDSADTDVTITGQGALLAALERSRTGQMADIVATIQGEQDEVIRAPLSGRLVVQGGPGTGKTAVALHRAAYLLYTHRFPLEHLGVLVIGPNPVFLRYIGHVLPSLGETGVKLSTISGLVEEADVRALESPEVAALKGDARMAKIIRRAIRNRQRPLREDLVVGFGAQHLRITAQETREIVEQVKRRGSTHNARRKTVERLITELLYGRYTQGMQRDAVRNVSSRSVGFEEFAEAMQSNLSFNAALDRMWPRLHAVELLHDLFGALPLLKLAAGKIFTKHEAELLYRERSSAMADIPWTEADMALLDEARILLGPTRALREGEAHLRTYGHVVCDETQDLSPMQLRMLGRRSLNGSMTLVGDIAQATGYWAPNSWDEILAHIGTRAKATKVELTIGYRTPEEVMQIANNVLHDMQLGVHPSRPVRRSGELPRKVLTNHPSQAVLEIVRATPTGNIGVITNSPHSVADVLSESGISAQVICDALAIGEEERVMIVTPELAKGLEFDSVIVIEPNEIARDHGLRALYVAITRTTKCLALVSSVPMLPILEEA